jgi:hypothetical protein
MDIPPDLEITITDIRNRGHCARMAKFFRTNGLRDEYAAMIRGGSINAQTLAATGDPRALDVVAAKMKEADHG